MNDIQPIEPPKGLPKGVKIAILIIILVILCLVLFTSCTSTNKIKTSEHTTTDSGQVKKKDSAGVSSLDSTKLKKDNTVTTKETDGDYTKETVIEFDTTKPLIVTPSGVDAKDYFPAVYTYPVKKITTKETGKLKTKEQIVTNTVDSTNVKRKDSAGVKTLDSTHLQKDTKTKGKEVHRTSYTGFIIIFSILLLLLILLYIYRKQIKNKLTIMKKLIPFLALTFALSFILSSCAPAYQGGGWFIPVAAGGLCLYCSYRTYVNRKTTDRTFPLICAVVMLLLCVIYIIYANVSK